MTIGRKLALVIEYDGTAYCGFQRQKEKPTIQQALEEALERFAGERVRVAGAGRTDSGVHALGQVVSFETTSSYPAETFLKALNYYLPQDIAVKQAVQVAEGFDPRRWATSRLYQYTMLRSATPSPLWARRALLVPEVLDIQAMDKGAAMLVGEWEQPLFADGSPSGSRRHAQAILHAQVAAEGPLVHFRVEANYFLARQVRRMAGALLQVGLGRNSPGRWDTGPALPPYGLYLMEVRYGGIPLGEVKGGWASLPKELAFY